ncbi:sugar ABC transporter substrate-binding protein [Rhodoligotrophos defluvii]|uniref:sugar ABC transporter substrate-binding protein n=1 Tax=Rhodoligotrophos defluvii TaxID=2561934 RepID=UPI001485754F|nr:sugar ABC transporter substrate-binding protein [Rhodoligotrophos defluvii]
MKRSWIAAAIAAAVGLGLTLPARAEGEAVAVFRLNQVDEHFESARIGADTMAAKMDAKVVHYVPIKPNNLAEAMSQLEDVLVSRPDLVLFMPLNPNSQLPLIRSIIKSGIPVVNFNDHTIAKTLFEALGGKGNVVILEGIKGNSTSDNRVIGFNKAAAEFPDIKVLASQPANYNRLEALQVMENLMQQHPQIDGVIAASDNMGVAAVEALEAAGRKGTRVVSIDGTTEGAQAVKDGKILAIAEFSGFKMACIAMELGLRSVRGEQVPKEVILPGALITAANVDEWLVPMDKRECPTLAEYAS